VAFLPVWYRDSTFGDEQLHFQNFTEALGTMGEDALVGY